MADIGILVKLGLLICISEFLVRLEFDLHGAGSVIFLIVTSLSVSTLSERSPSPSPWMIALDYPSELRNQHAQGTVVFELDFDPIGRVTGCKILQSSGNSRLDQTTCSLSHRRAKARDASPRVQTFQHVWKSPSI